MIELERDPAVLLDPRLPYRDLACLGVSIGQPASAIPKQRICEVSFSPMVRTTLRQGGQPVHYEGTDGQPADAALVHASVVYGTGVLHTDADVSFIVRRGRVEKLSVYGRWLSPLAELRTLPQLHARFGRPDRCLRLEAEGDLIAYDSYYAAAKKWVRWLASLERPTVVLLGEDADALRVAERAGISRRIEPIAGTS